MQVEMPSKKKEDLGAMSAAECMRLAKVVSDHTQLPLACQSYLDERDKHNKAWEGASFKDRSLAMSAQTAGRPNHHLLQRRMTDPRFSGNYHRLDHK